MKILHNIDSKYVIGFDIETVRVKEKFSELSEDYQSAWEYKHKQDGVVPSYEELEKIWEKNASLYAEFSKVCAVSLAFMNGDKLRCKNYVSSDERTILRELAATLDKFVSISPEYRLIGHSSKFFDVPFLCKRFIINGLEIPSVLDESESKPWESKLLDTNKLWKSFGEFNSPGSSLQALCTVLDVPVSKVDLVGDEVGAAFFRGELIRISDYCALDAIATFNVFRRFKYEPIFLDEEVVYVNKGEVMLNIPILDTILDSKNITEAQMKEFKTIFNSLTSEERIAARKILIASLSDDKGVIKQSLQTKIDKL